MSMETEDREYFEWSDAQDVLFEQYREMAKAQFFADIEQIVLNVEHHIPKDLEGEEVKNCHPKVADAIDQITQLALCYTYETEDGDFIDYEYEELLDDILSDELGYYKESGYE